MMSSPFTEIVPTWTDVSASSQMLFDLFVAPLEQQGPSHRLSDGAFYSLLVSAQFRPESPGNTLTFSEHKKTLHS